MVFIAVSVYLLIFIYEILINLNLVARWCCCGPCASAKLLAATLDQDCAFVNHCGPYLLIMFCSWLPIIGFCISLLSLYLAGAIRHNTRVQVGTGNAEHCFGDALLANCPLTAPCACCQVLRSQKVFLYVLVKTNFHFVLTKLLDRKLGLVPCPLG